MSVQEVRGRLDCGLEGVPESVSNDRVRGIRIFDVSDFRNPTQVAAVQTCRGSHTHTVAQEADENGNIYVYVSGTSRVRDDEELAGCSDDSPFENPESALFRIEVIEIPEDNPAEAKIVNRPFYFRTLIQARWRGFGTVVIMVKAHKPRVRPISVMTSRPTLKSDWLPVPVQGMAFCWISPIPLIRSDWIRS